MTGNDWLDPSTFRIQFDLKNNQDDDERLLYPIGGPWGFVSHLRVMPENETIDDIDILIAFIKWLTYSALQIVDKKNSIKKKLVSQK